MQRMQRTASASRRQDCPNRGHQHQRIMRDGHPERPRFPERTLADRTRKEDYGKDFAGNRKAPAVFNRCRSRISYARAAFRNPERRGSAEDKPRFLSGLLTCWNIVHTGRALHRSPCA